MPAITKNTTHTHPSLAPADQSRAPSWENITDVTPCLAAPPLLCWLFLLLLPPLTGSCCRSGCSGCLGLCSCACDWPSWALSLSPPPYFLPLSAGTVPGEAASLLACHGLHACTLRRLSTGGAFLTACNHQQGRVIAHSCKRGEIGVSPFRYRCKKMRTNVSHTRAEPQQERSYSAPFTKGSRMQHGVSDIFGCGEPTAAQD